MVATTWGKFDWQDPFRLEDQLDEEERMVRDTVREFVSEEPERPNYAQASFWLRFLLEDPELSVGLRAYLAGVAAGASAEGEELRRHLGRSWERLDADFERWIRLRFHDPR